MGIDPRAAREDRWPRPVSPRLPARVTYLLHRAFAANAGYTRLAGWLERHPRALRWFTTTERIAKENLFGCRMCGQCALPSTGYACPMGCPKQLRNGPCGGVSPDGACEVHPGLRCVWLVAFDRAEQAGHGADLDLLQRPVDHRRWGESSWVNYWQRRDDGMGAAPGPERPLLHRELGLRPR